MPAQLFSQWIRSERCIIACGTNHRFDGFVLASGIFLVNRNTVLLFVDLYFVRRRCICPSARPQKGQKKDNYHCRSQHPFASLISFHGSPHFS
jgi:hypothetical protein